jgi:hypothetical protein
MLRLAAHICPLWDKEQLNSEFIVMNHHRNCCVRAFCVAVLRVIFFFYLLWI